jgi:hypothetical protein
VVRICSAESLLTIQLRPPTAPKYGRDSVNACAGTNQLVPEGGSVAELQYPTDLDLTGPWLITAEQLSALDEIVGREIRTLQESADARLQNAVDEEVARFYGSLSAEERKKRHQEVHARLRESGRFEVTTEVLVSLPDGKRLRAGGLREVSQDPEIAGSRIISLDMNFGGRSRAIKCSFSVGGQWNKNLRLSVSGDDQQERERLFIELRNWVHDVMAPQWQRIWNRIASTQLHWFVLVGLIVMSTSIVTSATESPYIGAAHALLAKGLQSKDITKALELVLALESNYRPNPSRRALPFWFLVLVVAGPITCTMLSARPKIEIGLGKGRTRLRLWNLWMRFVAITIPLSILGALGQNFLNSIIGKL